MKKSEMYENIMDVLDVIHKENVALGRLLMIASGAEEYHAEALEKQWNEKYKKARKDS